MAAQISGMFVLCGDYDHRNEANEKDFTDKVEKITEFAKTLGVFIEPVSPKEAETLAEAVLGGLPKS